MTLIERDNQAKAKTDGLELFPLTQRFKLFPLTQKSSHVDL